MMIEVIFGWIGSALISGAISGLLIYYFRRYIDGKLEEEHREKARREERRKAMSMAEQQQRHAAGRLLFWLHHAVANGDCSTELQEAMDNYQRAERKQKTLEQEILAVYNERIPD